MNTLASTALLLLLPLIAAHANAQSAVSWGRNQFGQCTVPGLPAGVTYVEIACGRSHSVARRSDGTVVAWGENLSGQCSVPALAPGLVYVEIAGGGNHSVARRSDGTVLAWGDNTQGQCNVPTLPPGITCVEIAAGEQHTLARCSDGSVVAWGGGVGLQVVPRLPPGRTYVEVACGRHHSLARRSDGLMVAWGDNTLGQCNVPALPAGLSYVSIAGGGDHSLALRSDGTVVAWGDDAMGQSTVPGLPSGQSFVEVACGDAHSLARRSDGFVYAWGANNHGQCNPPVLPPGRTFHDLAAGSDHTVARFGPPSQASYASIGRGCYDRAQSFYEQFTVPASAFDLGHSTIVMTMTGAGYNVGVFPNTVVFAPPISPDLGLGHNSVTPPLTLPFPLPYPGGVTNQIVVGSNGYVFLQPSANAAAFHGDVQDLLNGRARHAPMWGDYDPGAGTGGGTVHLDIDASSQVVSVTWMAIQECNAPGAVSTFQVAMAATGAVEYRYLDCAMAAAPVLTGWSPGAGVPDPGSRDLSASLSFGTVSGFSLPLLQLAKNRPGVGTSWNLETHQIPVTGVLGLQILGTSNPDLADLSMLGMPDCGLHASLDVVTAFAPTAAMHGWSLAIPNQAGLIGLHVYATSALWTAPAQNAFGMLTANGIDGAIGFP